jgi:hypothetical protein
LRVLKVKYSVWDFIHATFLPSYPCRPPCSQVLRSPSAWA